MRDYRQILFGPPELDSYIADNTEANLKELEFFRNTMTPEVAERAANISKAYPNLDPKLVMYGSLLGVEHDSNLALELASRQNNVTIKNNQKALQSVSRGKRASQLGLLMLDLGFQPLSRNFKSTIVATDNSNVKANKYQTVAANTLLGLAGAATAIATLGTKDGEVAAERMRRAIFGDKFADVYKEAKDNYGPTEFNLAYDQWSQGKPVNLGKGFFPASTKIQDTQGYKDFKRQGLSDEDAYREAVEIYGVPITEQFEELENQYKTQTRKAGQVDISPGRIVAGQFYKKEDFGYAIGSAVLDGAFRVFGDPTNYALGYFSGAKLGLRSLVDEGVQQAFKTVKVGDDIKNVPLIKQFIQTIKGGKIEVGGVERTITPKEARKLMFGSTASQILETKRGDKLLDAFVANKDLSVLMDMPGLNQAPPELLRLLTAIDDENLMKTVLTSVMKNGNLAGVDDALALRYGITDDVVQAIVRGNQLTVPIAPNLLGSASNAIAKKLLGKDTDINVARNILKQINRSKAVFNKNTADNLFTGIIGVGSDLRRTLPRRLSRYFDLAPARLLSINNLGESARSLDGLMKAARFSRDARNRFLNDILDTDATDDMLTIVRNVYADIKDNIVERNPDLADFRDELAETMDFLANESDLKRYLTTEDGKQLAYPGVKYKIKTRRKKPNGEEEIVWEATPTAQMISEYIDNYIPLIDYAELEAYFPLFRKIVGAKKSAKREFIEGSTEEAYTRLLKRIYGKKLKPEPRTGRMTPSAQTTMGYLYEDLILQRVLKPVWMLRPALITRVIPEEALRIIFSGSGVGLNHPMAYYAFKLAAGTSLEMRDAYDKVLWGTRILKKEKPFTEEILGPEFIKAASIEYPQIEAILKHIKIGVNEVGMASDDYVAWVVAGNDARDYIFREQGLEIITALKQGSGLLKETTTDGDSIAKAIANNRTGGSIDMKTGQLNPPQFGAVSPYKNLGVDFAVGELAEALGKSPGTNLEELLEPLLINFLKDDAQAAIRQKYLNKQNHVLGWWLDEVDNRLYLDVSVYLNKLTDVTPKNIEKALVGLSTLGIKGKQLSAYIPDDTVGEVFLANLLNSDDLKMWKKVIDTDDNLLWFVNKNAPNKETLRNASTQDLVTRKAVMEALFDTNFDVAKIIRRNKRGIGNVAPDGSWLPLNENYLQAMSRKAMNQFFEPVKANNLDGVYTGYDKIVNGQIQPDYIRNWVHQLLLLAKNPVTARLINDGIDETMDYLLKSYDGKQIMQKLVKESDLRGREAKEQLENPVALRNNLEALGYRISRHIGGEFSILDPITGTPRTEDWATQIRFTNGVMTYPLYKYNFDTGSSAALNFLKSGGFVNGQDWVEAWSIASSGGGMRTVQGQVGKFYKDVWKIFKKDINVFPNKVNGAYLSLNNKFKSQGGLDAAAGRMDLFLEKLYTTFLTGPSDIVNRDPLWRYSLYEGGIEAIKDMDEQTALDFLKGAEASLRGSKVGDDILGDIVDEITTYREVGFGGEINNIDDLMLILGKKAAQITMDLLYSTKQRHQFSDTLSSYIPFPEIGVEVYKSWGKLLGTAPQKFNRTRIAFDAGDEGKPWDAEMGFFFTDPVSGKRMFSYPDPFGIIQKGFFGDDYRDQGVRVRPAGFLSALNLVTANGFLPGTGPREVWALEFFEDLVTTLPKFITRNVLGDFRTDVGDPYSLLAEFIPSYAEKFFTAEYFNNNSVDKLDERYASSVIDTLAAMYATGNLDPTDTALAAEQKEEFKQAANNQWLVRGLVQATAPTAIQPRIELKDKNGQWWFVQTLKEEYRKMLEVNDYDYSITTTEFIDRFGINPIPLTQTKKRSEYKTPYTESAVEFWTTPENRKVMESHPRTAYFIRPDTIDDDWTWSADFNRLRDYYNEDQWDLLTKQTLLERELQLYKEELQTVADKSDTDKYTNVWVDGNYALYRREKEEEYGVKAFASLGFGEIKADPSLDIQELYTWEDNTVLRQSPEFVPLNKYLELRTEAEEVLNNGGEWMGVRLAKPNRPSVSPLTSQTDRAAAVRDVLLEEGKKLIKEYEDTFFNQLFYGILFYEVDNMRYDR